MRRRHKSSYGRVRNETKMDDKTRAPVKKSWIEWGTPTGCLFAILCFFIGLFLPLALLYTAYLATR